MALQSLRSLQFSSSAATTISNHLDSHDFLTTPTCSCTTHHCSDMNAPRSQIINNNNKKFRFHLDIGGQTKAAPVSTVLIGMNGTRLIRPADLNNTLTLCKCFNDINDTRNTLDVRINHLGEVHSIESTQKGAAECTLGGNLSGLDLTGADFTNKCLNNTNFSGATITDVDFSNAVLDDANFTSVTSFAGVNFTNVHLSTIKNVNSSDGPFVNKSFLGGNLSNIWNHGSLANFTGADFSGTTWGSTQWGGNYTNADFRFAITTSWNWTHDSDLTNANFSGRKDDLFKLWSGAMTNLNLSLSTIKRLILGGGTMLADKVNFAGLVVEDGKASSFFYLTMKNSIFSGASLKGITLSYVDFTGSDFSGADLTGAVVPESVPANKFNDSNFTNADLTGAIIAADADFTGVTWSNTTCPDGTNSDNNTPKTCVGHLNLTPS